MQKLSTRQDRFLTCSVAFIWSKISPTVVSSSKIPGSGVVKPKKEKGKLELVVSRNKEGSIVKSKLRKEFGVEPRSSGDAVDPKPSIKSGSKTSESVVWGFMLKKRESVVWGLKKMESVVWGLGLKNRASVVWGLGLKKGAVVGSGLNTNESVVISKIIIFCVPVTSPKSGNAVVNPLGLKISSKLGSSITIELVETMRWKETGVFRRTESAVAVSKKTSKLEMYSVSDSRFPTVTATLFRSWSSASAKVAVVPLITSFVEGLSNLMT